MAISHCITTMLTRAPGIIYRFDTAGKDPEAIKRLAEDALDETEEPSRRLVCHNCRYLITTDNRRIEVAGGHSHTCTNPHGIVYQVECFSAAPGCREIGAAYQEYSWFTGYRWQVAICGQCQEHMGWQFRGEHSFYGLIRDRLRVADDNTG